jgi:hypothetical protein
MGARRSEVFRPNDVHHRNSDRFSVCILAGRLDSAGVVLSTRQQGDEVKTDVVSSYISDGFHYDPGDTDEPVHGLDHER